MLFSSLLPTHPLRSHHILSRALAVVHRLFLSLLFSHQKRTAQQYRPVDPLANRTLTSAQRSHMQLQTKKSAKQGAVSSAHRVYIIKEMYVRGGGGCKISLPSSIFCKDCAVTACFFPRYFTYGVNPSKSLRAYVQNRPGKEVVSINMRAPQKKVGFAKRCCCCSAGRRSIHRGNSTYRLYNCARNH